MGVIKKQSIKSALIAYVGVVLGFINIMILMPRILTPDQLGLVRVLLDISIIFLTIAQLGLPTLAVKFFPWFKDKQKQFYGFLNFLFVVAFLGFTIAGILFYLFKQPIEHFYLEKSALLNQYLYLVYGFASFMLLFVIFESYARALLKIVVPNFLRDNLVRIGVFFMLIMMYLNWLNFEQFLNAYIIVYAVAALCLAYYLKQLNVFFIYKKPTIFKHAKFKEMIPFAAFTIFASASGMMQAKIDTLMITGLAGLNFTGIYSIAFFVATTIEIPRRSIGQIAIPIVAQAWKENDLPKINMLYQKTALNQLVVGLGLFLLLWLSIDNLLLFLPETYRAGKWVILLIGLARVVDMGMGINTEILATSIYYKWDLLLKVLLIILSILFNYLWIPTYGIDGAAFATLLAFLIYNLLRCILLWLKFKFLPFSKAQFACLLIGLITFGLVWCMPSFKNFIIDIVFKSFLIISVYGGIHVLFKVSEDINLVINQLYQKFIR